MHRPFICLKKRSNKKTQNILEDISLASFQKSSFSNISKAKVNKVRNLPHEEVMELINFQRKTLG